MALNVAILVFFVLAMLGVFVYTVLTARPRREKEPHGAEAVQEAIDRYDRLQQSAWRRGRFPLDPSLGTPWSFRKRRRVRGRRHEHTD